MENQEDVIISKSGTNPNSDVNEKDFESTENNTNINDEQISIAEDIENNNTNVTNCLALTIQEDHKLIAVKHVFLKTLRMSWKVAFTSITLALIRLFS